MQRSNGSGFYTNMRQFFGHIQYNNITIGNYTIDSLNQNTHTL